MLLIVLHPTISTSNEAKGIMEVSDQSMARLGILGRTTAKSE